MAIETLTLDGVVSSSNLTGATVANLNAQDGNWAAVTDNTAGTDLIVSFPTPANPPISGAGLQTIRVQARKNATGGATATFTIAVREGGVDLATSSAFTVTSTTGEVFDFTFDASLVSSAANVEAHMVGAATGGKPADRRSVGFGYVAWLADTQAVANATGTMAATESGTDAFAATGTVADPGITGTLAATEAGTDTASASGTVAVAGALVATETGADAASMAGNVPVAGNLSATEAGNDTSAGSGSVAVSGALTAAETGADGFAATGAVGSTGVTGAMAAAESGADTATASGLVLIRGGLAAVEAANDNFGGAGNVSSGGAVTGTLAAVETGLDIFSTIKWRRQRVKGRRAHGSGALRRLHGWAARRA